MGSDVDVGTPPVASVDRDPGILVLWEDVPK